MAQAASVPIVIEKLDFARKKAELEGENRKYARMLSGFACKRIVETIRARAFDAGIEVREVNPACTSIIGRHKFASRYGITKHQAAAAVIGRRSQNCSERLNRHMLEQVTFPLPARNRGKHVWSFWRKVARSEAAHEALLRLAKRQSTSPEKSRDAGSTRSMPARSRHASPEHYSLDEYELQDLPF